MHLPFPIQVALVTLSWVMVSATYATQKWCGDVLNPTMNYVLNISTGYGAPDGYARSMLMVNGQSPGPLITAEQGQTMVVTVQNDLAVQIGMHWHGIHQRGSPQFDGVPGLNQYAIPPGANMTYCFGTSDNYGAYWYHVHLRDTYQDGIRGPILISPNSTIQTPYHLISNDSADISAMQEAARSAATLMVNDWFHATSEEITARYDATGDSMRPLCANSVLFNGMGRVQCPPAGPNRDSFGCTSMMSNATDSGNRSTNTMASVATSTTMSPMSMGSMSSMKRSTRLGTVPDPMSDTSVPMELTCANTTSKLYTLDFPSNASWLMFHLINSGASQHLAFSIDEHELWIISADGAFVEPSKVQVIDISIGQRYGVLVKKPQASKQAYSIRASTRAEQIYQGVAILQYAANSTNGSVDPKTAPYINLSGSPLSSSVTTLEETRLSPFPRLAMPVSNRFIYLDVKQSQPTEWVLQSGTHFSSNNGQQIPLLFAPRNQSGVVTLNKGDIVDVVLQISADSLDPMAHPIHLHGHSFRLLGSSANSTFPANMTIQQLTAMQGTGNMTAMEFKLITDSAAPYRDTAELPRNGWLAIRFVADNPGVWLLHCHINAHLTAGMAIAFMELPGEFPPFSDFIITPPMVAPFAPIS